MLNRRSRKEESTLTHVEKETRQREMTQDGAMGIAGAIIMVYGNVLFGAGYVVTALAGFGLRAYDDYQRKLAEEVHDFHPGMNKIQKPPINDPDSDDERPSYCSQTKKLLKSTFCSTSTPKPSDSDNPHVITRHPIRPRSRYIPNRSESASPNSDSDHNIKGYRC